MPGLSRTMYTQHCMAQSSQNSIGQSLGALRLFNKGRSFFGIRSTQSLHGDLQSNTNVSITPPTTSQKKFKKNNDARHDIGVLAMTYILHDNSTIQELIRLIIKLHNCDDGKLSEILASSATFTVQLASFHEKDSSRALTAVTDFLKAMHVIDAMARDATKTTNDMKDMIIDSIKQIKSTYPSLNDRDRGIGGDTGLSGILDTIIGTTSTILNILNDASDAIPVPIVKPLVACVATLLKAVQQTRSNYDDMRQVATVAEEFVVMLAVVCAGDEMKPSPRFQQALNGFQKKLQDIAQQCNKLSRRNILWRFFLQGDDQNSLSAIKEDLQIAVQQFQTEAQLLQHFDLRSLGQVINGKLDEDAVNALPKPRSHVGRRDQYLPGSRDDVIKVIADWLEDPNHLTFWMRGGAGLGKSTLAHKIVDSLQADGRLATFAFLLRDSSSDAATVIQQMARELGALHPRAIPGVAVAARTCKASHQSLHEYMESYIIKPIHSLSYPYPLVIVIDGLDEWEHHEVFLEELEHLSPMSPLKFLLISRPNHSIERSLLKVSVQKYNLPPVSQAITEAYFNHHFEKIDWKMRKPSSFIISDLARLADGLLIWAAMVCSFLSYKMRPDSPHELLEQIIASGKQIALESQLSNLYHDALKQLFQNDKEQQLFRRVFGAMTVLREPLPLRDFARLLGVYVTVDQIMEVQSRLTALQTRGTFDEDIVPPASQCFHSSFLEFTMDREIDPSNPSIPYLINLQKAHESLAEGCLSSLSHFFLLFRGSKRIHSDLRGLELYAVEFWPLHVANSNDRFTPLAPKLENVLLEFTESHLRQWASLFLAISLPTASSQNWDEVVDRIDKDGFYCSLAGFLKDQMTMDPALASRITLCLEVAVRLQPKYEKAWGDLGTSYQEQFNSIGTLDSINNSITVYRHALKLCSKDGNRGTSMSNLGAAVWQRFSRAGSVTDLEESISLLRESLSLLCAPHPDRHTSLISFSNALRSRFQVMGSMADLEEAISVLHESVSLQPDNSTSIGYLASALLSRFRETNSDIDLEQGISMLRELLLLINIPAESSWILGHLGNALRDRFGKTGSIADLEEAISVLRESLSLRPAPRDHYSSPSLEKLAYALRNRFQITRSMIDLEEAILMYRESLSLRPKPHPDRPQSLNYLSDTLCDRFEETGSIADIHEAISLLRESLSLHPAPHPERFYTLNSLTHALWNRFRTTGSMTDLEEAILLYRESLCLCPASQCIWVMEGLASALETRFNANGVQSDLSEATSLRQQALALSQ